MFLRKIAIRVLFALAALICSAGNPAYASGSPLPAPALQARIGNHIGNDIGNHGEDAVPANGNDDAAGEVTEADIEAWRRDADKGDPEAQYQLGVAYEFGNAVQQNFDRATRWYRQAAEQGYAPAQDRLGYAYHHGQGVSRDYEEALRWYREAARQDLAEAMTNIGFMYYLGVGVPKNVIEGVRWYRKGAELGDAAAQYNLGVAYSTGEGIRQDAAEAISWYEKSAEQGDADAMYALGQVYYNGQDMPQNYPVALKWFESSAQLGNAEAQNTLGYMSLLGEGMEQDFDYAMQRFREAIDQDYAEAFYHVGSMYQDGLGVERNPRYALQWYREAVDRGYEPAEEKVSELSGTPEYDGTSESDGIAESDDESEQETAASAGNAPRGMIDRAIGDAGQDSPETRELLAKYPPSVTNAWLKEIDIPLDTVIPDALVEIGKLFDAGNFYAGLILERICTTSTNPKLLGMRETVREANIGNNCLPLLRRDARADNPVALGQLGDVRLFSLAGMPEETTPEDIELGQLLWLRSTMLKYGASVERMAEWLKELDAPARPTKEAAEMIARLRKLFDNGNPFAVTQLTRAYRMSEGPGAAAGFWEETDFRLQNQPMLLKMSHEEDSRALDLMAEVYKHGFADTPDDRDLQKQMANEFVKRAEALRPYPLPDLDTTRLKFWMNDIRRFRGVDELVNNLSTLETMYADGNLVAGLYIESVMDKLQSPLEAEWNDRNRQNMTTAILRKLADEGDDIAKKLLDFARIGGLGGEITKE